MSRPVLSLKPKLVSVARATTSLRLAPQEAPQVLGETIPSSPRLGRIDPTVGNSPPSPMVVIDWLTHTYPDLFNRSDVKPLKIGILADLLPAIREVGFSRTLAKRALGFWTSRIAYQRALALGGPRYDLQGAVCGEVTDEQQSLAREQVGSIRAKSKAGREDVC